jgi:hypothetical protein
MSAPTKSSQINIGASKVRLYRQKRRSQSQFSLLSGR